MQRNFLAAIFQKIKASWNNKAYRKSILAIMAFLLLNALKTTLFNYFLIPQANRDIFNYKFWVALLCTIIVYSVVFSIRSRYVFLSIFTIQGIYIFTNISYYLYYHSYLHFLQWISLFKEALISASHLANPKSFQLIIVFIDIPAALYIFFKYYKADVWKMRVPFLRNFVLVISLLSLILVENNNYDQNRFISDYMNDRYSGETKIVERYGTIVNATVNIIKNSSESKLINQIYYGSKKMGGSIKSPGASINTQKPNYVIIQVESMDSNIIKQQYKGQYVMPYLNSLKESSVYYPFTLSYHKGGGTSDTEFSIINSVEPLDSFPAIKLTSYTYPNSIVSKLSAASYNTMAFHGNVGTFYNRDIAFSMMGFNRFYDITSMNYKDEGWGAPDDKVFSFAYDKIAKSKKPFFSYIITMTSHGPFESARNYYNNVWYDDIDNENVKNYFNSFTYIDNSLSDFISKIRTDFSNTYIFIYGDHTPNINNELYFQASFTEVDKYFEFVPLFIITPDNRKYKETEEAASFLDVAPTILETSGIPYTLYTYGSDLLNTSRSSLPIPYKMNLFDRKWLYKKISEHTYTKEESLWQKNLPSFITSNLIERHKK